MTLKIGVYQFNPKVSSVADNIDDICVQAALAANLGCNLFITPELAIVGYTSYDLMLRAELYQQIDMHFNKLLTIPGIVLLVGLPVWLKTRYTPHPLYRHNVLYNSVAIIDNTELIGYYSKCSIPNYGIFNEQRYFVSDNQPFKFECNDYKIGILICEDVWVPPAFIREYNDVDLICSLNSSPFEVAKYQERYRVANYVNKITDAALLYVNQVGGEGDVLFDGGSFLMNKNGKIDVQLPFFKEDFYVVEFNPNQPNDVIYEINAIASIYDALKLALSDYITKNDFDYVVIGISGGIDSALVLAIAVDVLGANKVHTLYMPSCYTSELSDNCVAELLANLAIQHHSTIAIDSLMDNYYTALKPCMMVTDEGHTAQNIQARIRGNLLMAFANENNALLLSTSNKSEIATGYTTLYGDMAGGFCLLKDVYKTSIYELVNYYNSTHMAQIPQSIVLRKPTAELYKNQVDSDTLPEYEILDKILFDLIERNLSCAEICDNYDPLVLMQVTELLQNSEYKRKQTPLGPKLTIKSFARKEWQYPVKYDLLHMDNAS